VPRGLSIEADAVRIESRKPAWRRITSKEMPDEAVLAQCLSA
jgi:hypothetical protein